MGCGALVFIPEVLSPDADDDEISTSVPELRVVAVVLKRVPYVVRFMTRVQAFRRLVERHSLWRQEVRSHRLSHFIPDNTTPDSLRGSISTQPYLPILLSESRHVLVTPTWYLSAFSVFFLVGRRLAATSGGNWPGASV